MMGDPHTLRADAVMPEAALMWPGQRVVVAHNERNGVVVVFVLDPVSAKPSAWPRGMTEAEIDEICAQCLDAGAAAGL